MADHNQTSNVYSNVSSNVSSIIELEAGEWYPYFILTYLLISLVVTGGNVLTMAAYWITPHLQTPPNLLIFNLSLVDSFVPYLCLPWMVLNYTQAGLDYLQRSKWGCGIWLFTTITGITASLVAISAMSLERFVAILFPYRYYTLITDRSVKIINAFSWLIPIVLSALPLVIADWNIWVPGKLCLSMYVYHPNYNFFMTVFRTLLLAVAAVMNICIAVVAVRKRKVGPSSTAQAPEGSQGPQPEKFNWKLTKMLLTVVGVFYACWLPYTLLTALYTTRIESAPRWLRISHDFIKLLIGVNSAVNPLIYAKGNPKYLEAFKKILTRKTGS